MVKQGDRKKSKKNNKSQPARRRISGTIMNRPVSIYSSGNAVRELACSLMDPWSCSACIPDGRTNSACFSIKSVGTIGTGLAGGACGIYACPQINGMIVIDTASVVTTATIPANWSTQQNAVINTNYRSYRPVSCGIRFTYIGNTQTDQGNIMVGQMPDNTSLFGFNGFTESNFTQSVGDYKTFSLRSGAQVVWRPESIDDLGIWQNVSAVASATNVPSGFPIIFASVFGASATAATSCIQYEVVWNYEGQLGNNQYIPGGIQSVTRNANRAEPGWYEKVKNIIDKVTPFVPMVGNVLGGFFGAPGLGTLASSAMGTMAMGNGQSYKSMTGRNSRIGL